MICAGVDLASRPATTASCVIDFSARGAEVVELTTGVDDGSIVELIGRCDKVGIDVPLGWPASFVKAVAGHGVDGSWPATYRHEDNEHLRLRRTDVWIHRDLGMPAPLSVSTDRIAIPAMRAAALLSRLQPRVRLDGSGVVVEVYPAAALRRWGLDSRGYKHQENRDRRRELLRRLRELTPWLAVAAEHRDLCVESDDAFDSLVAALVARARAVGLVEEVPFEYQHDAAREGWIAVPLVGSLTRLVEWPSDGGG